MFNASMLSPEERELYDNTMYDAVMRPDGTAYPTREIGDRLYSQILNLAASGHDWAEDFIATCATQSMGRRGKEWAKSQSLIETPDGDRIVSKSALVATKRRSASGKKDVDQLVLWEQASRDDLIQVIARDQRMAHGLGIEIATAKKLLDLINRHRCESVSDALSAAGITLQDFLDQDVA